MNTPRPEPRREARPDRGHDADVAWWRRALVYQIYIRSFADGNGDGTGDIAGLRSRLPYLESLGVDAVWLNPWNPSPLRDGGYDVSDYRDIDARYGTSPKQKRSSPRRMIATSG